jgi:hypothetical protein
MAWTLLAFGVLKMVVVALEEAAVDLEAKEVPRPIKPKFFAHHVASTGLEIIASETLCSALSSSLCCVPKLLLVRKLLEAIATDEGRATGVAIEREGWYVPTVDVIFLLLLLFLQEILNYHCIQQQLRTS